MNDDREQIYEQLRKDLEEVLTRFRHANPEELVSSTIGTLEIVKMNLYMQLPEE